MSFTKPRQGAAGKLMFLGDLPYLRKPPVKQPRWIITGVTKNNAGNPIGGCLVQMYETTALIAGCQCAPTNPLLKAEVTSDANGNFVIEGNGSPQTYKLVAYKPGTPDIAGTTVNTLTTIDG